MLLVVGSTSLGLAQAGDRGGWCSDIAATDNWVAERAGSILGLVTKGCWRDIRRFVSC